MTCVLFNVNVLFIFQIFPFTFVFIDCEATPCAIMIKNHDKAAEY